MKYYCYLRNIQNILSDGKTSYERRFGESFRINDWVSSDFCPMSVKTQSICNESSVRILPMICFLCESIWNTKNSADKKINEIFTGAGWESYLTQIFPCSRSLCRLTQWWLVRKSSLRKTLDDQSPRLEEVIDVEEWEMEEEFDDKSGITIGSKFSPCYIIFEYRFQWDVVFDRWSIRKNMRFHRKAFPSDKTSDVFSRTFIVKNISNSLT